MRIPGFVDHHAHLVRYGGVPQAPYDRADPGSIGAWHRDVAARGSTPMDEAPEPAGPDLPERIHRILETAARAGLVEVTEAGLLDPSHLDALRTLRERGPLPTRVRILVASGLAEAAMPTRLGDPWLEVVGVKFYADGWVGPRTCALGHAFDDRPGDDGVLFLPPDQLARRAAPFAERGWTIATHAIGDRAIEAVLNAYERVYGEDCATASPRIEHAQVLRADLVARMAEMGVTACIQPSFAVSDAMSARAALGVERMETAYRWSALLDAGVRVITGSDWPIESMSPLVGLQHLVTGAGDDGEPVAEALPVDVALALMTDADAGTTDLAADPTALAHSAIASITVLGTQPAEGTAPADPGPGPPRRAEGV